MDQQKSLKDAVKSQEKIEESSVSNCSPNDSKVQLQKNLVVQSGSSTHTEDVSHKSSGRKGPSSISNSVTPNSVGGKSMNTLGSKGRSTHSEDVSNKTSGRKGPSSISNSVTPNSMGGKSMNTLGSKGRSTHSEDVSNKTSGRKGPSSISNSVTPNSMGGKSMNTLGSKGRSTHSEDVSNKTSGRKGPSSISNSVTPNSMGGKSMNTLGSKGRSTHSEDVSNKTSGRKGPSSISNSVTPNSMGGKSMNTLGSKGRSTHSEDVSNKTSGSKGPSSISNSVTPSSVGGKSMNTLSSKGGKSTPRSNRQPLPITPIGNCKTCRPTPNLNTSSIHLFDGTTPTIKAPLGTAMSAGSNDDGGHPSANPPQLCMATSVTGLKDYALAYNKDKFRVTLPLGVNSNTTLEELRQKTDVIGSVARRGSDSAFEAVRGKIKKDGAKRFTLPSLQRKRKSYHGEMRADAEEETDANSAGPKPGLPVTALSDNMVTAKSNIEKSKCRGDNTTSKEHRWPFDSFSEHQRRNSDQNLTLKPEFENFVKKLQSGEQTEDPSDGCMTTVGRRVKTGNPIVLVGEIKHSDGTAKKIVVLGTLRKHEEDNKQDKLFGSGDSAATLSQAFLPTTLQHHPKGATSFAEEENVIPVAAEQENDEFKASNDTANPLRKFANNLKFRFVAASNRLKAKPKKFAKPLSIFKEKDDPSTSQSSSSSDEEYIELDLDTSAALSIGRKHHSTPDQSSNLKPKGKLLYRIPTASENPCRLERTLDKKMKIFRKEIKQITDGRLQLWKRHNKSWLDSNELRALKYNHSSLSLNNLIDPKNITKATAMVKEALNTYPFRNKIDLRMLKTKQDIYKYSSQLERKSSLDLGCEERSKTYNNSSFYRKFIDAVRQRVEIGSFRRGINLSDKYYDPEEDEGFIKPKLVKDITLYRKDGKGKLEELYNSDEMIDSQLTLSEEEFEPSDDTSSGSHQSALYSNGDYSVYSTNVSNSSVSENITSEPSSDEDDMTDENSSSPATSNSSDNSTSGKTETENSTEATASQTATSATYSTSTTSEDTYGTGDGYTSSKQSSTSVLQVSTGPKRRKTKEKISFKESKKAEDCKKLVCIGKRDSRQNISTGDFFVANSAGGDPNSLSATSAIKSFKRVRFANVSRMDCTMQGITNNMFNMISKSRLLKLETKSCTDLPSTRKNRKRFTYGKDVNSNLANEQRTKARYLDRTFVSNSFPLYEKGDYREIMHAMRKSLSMLKGSGQMNKHCDKYMYSQSVSEKMLPEDSTFHGKLKSNLTYSTEFHRRTIIQIGRNPGKGRNRNTVPVVRAGPTKNVQYSSEESNSSSETNTNKETNYDTVASQSTETDLSNKLPYSSQSYQRDTSETSADTQTERTYDSVAGSDENNYSLSKSADVSLWSGTDDTTDINNSSVAATTSSGSDSNISSDSSEKRELPSAATASSGNDSNISIDKSNKSEFSSHTHTTISNTGKSKNYSLSVRLSTTRSLSWKKSKELPGFPGSIRIPGEFHNSTALNKFSSNENILSLNTSVHEADGSKLNITLSNTQKKDLSTPSSKTNCSALKTEELPGFPGSKSVCSEDQSQNTLKSCSSRSVPKLTNFFSFQQSLQDVNLDWSRSPKSNVFSKIHGQVADSVRKPKSLGSSQSLNSSISSEFNIFGDPKNPRKSFPAGLLKLGSQDYSSTNISGLTTWWDSESEIKTDVDKPSEASLQPLLEKDDREVRMRGIKNRKSVDFRSRAAMLYLRGDGLLMQTMQKKDHEKVGNYREYLKFSNKYGRLDVSPSLQDIHCLKAVERLQVSNTKDQAISGKLQLACDHPDCLSRHSPSNVKLPGLLPVEEQKTPAEVTLKDVTDLLTHSKIRKDLYYSDSENSGQWTSSCKKCPQHQKRFFPFFPDLFEKYGIQPLAERVVDYAMLGGKESFNLHFPLYTEDDVDTFTDEFAFKALRDGVAKFLIEDAINTSWMDLQSEVLYQDLLRQEIRDTIHLGVIDVYSKSCINAGRRTIIIENYIKENTPPEVTVTKTESVRSLLPIPDLPDNSKFIAFSPTLPSNDETRDKLPGTDATGIIPIEGGDKTQNLMPSYLNTKITALKLISKATDKGIYRFLNPESIYETATELSFRSSDFDIHSEFLEDGGFASDDHITLQVGSLVDDMVAAVVISDELGLNSFQPMPMNDLYPNINEDVEFVVYKMVCQVSVCDELVNRGLASRNNALLKLPGYLSRKHTAPSNETSTGDSDTEQSTLVEASLSAESGSRSETKSQSSATYSSSPDRTYNDEKDSDSEDQESAPHVSTRAISNTKMKNKQLFRGLVKKTKILISSTARSNGTESHKSSTSKFPKSVKGLFKRFNPKRNKPDQRTHSNLVEENGSKVYTRQPEISNVSSDSSGSDYFPIDAILSENADDANCSKNIRSCCVSDTSSSSLGESYNQLNTMERSELRDSYDHVSYSDSTLSDFALHPSSGIRRFAFRNRKDNDLKDNQVFGTMPLTMVEKFGNIAKHLTEEEKKQSLENHDDSQPGYSFFASSSASDSTVFTPFPSCGVTQNVDSSENEYVEFIPAFYPFYENTRVDNASTVLIDLCNNYASEKNDDQSTFSDSRGIPSSESIVTDFSDVTEESSIATSSQLYEAHIGDAIMPSGMPCVNQHDHSSGTNNFNQGAGSSITDSKAKLKQTKTSSPINRELCKPQSAKSIRDYSVTEELDCLQPMSKEAGSSRFITIGCRSFSANDNSADAEKGKHKQSSEVTIGKRIAEKLSVRGLVKVRPTEELDENISSHLFVETKGEGSDVVNECSQKLYVNAGTNVNAFKHILTEIPREEIVESERTSITVASCHVESEANENADRRQPSSLRVVWEMSKTCLDQCIALQKPFDIRLRGLPGLDKDAGFFVGESREEITSTYGRSKDHTKESDEDVVSGEFGSYCINDLVSELNEEMNRVHQIFESEDTSLDNKTIRSNKYSATASNKQTKVATEVTQLVQTLGELQSSMTTLVETVYQTKNISSASSCTQACSCSNEKCNSSFIDELAKTFRDLIGEISNQTRYETEQTLQNSLSKHFTQVNLQTNRLQKIDSRNSALYSISDDDQYFVCKPSGGCSRHSCTQTPRNSSDLHMPYDRHQRKLTSCKHQCAPKETILQGSLVSDQLTACTSSSLDIGNLSNTRNAPLPAGQAARTSLCKGRSHQSFSKEQQHECQKNDMSPAHQLSCSEDGEQPYADPNYISQISDEFERKNHTTENSLQKSNTDGKSFRINLNGLGIKRDDDLTKNYTRSCSPSSPLSKKKASPRKVTFSDCLIEDDLSKNDKNEDRDVYYTFPLLSPSTKVKRVRIQDESNYSKNIRLKNATALSNKTYAAAETAHSRANQPNDSVQLPVPVLTDFFEELQPIRRRKWRSKPQESLITQGVMENTDDRSSRTVKIVGCRSEQLSNIMTPSSGKESERKTTILVNRGNRTPEKVSSESIDDQPHHSHDANDFQTKLDKKDVFGKEDQVTMQSNTNSTNEQFSAHQSPKPVAVDDVEDHRKFSHPRHTQKKLSRDIPRRFAESTSTLAQSPRQQDVEDMVSAETTHYDKEPSNLKALRKIDDVTGSKQVILGRANKCISVGKNEIRPKSSAQTSYPSHASASPGSYDYIDGLTVNKTEMNTKRPKVDDIFLSACNQKQHCNKNKSSLRPVPAKLGKQKTRRSLTYSHSSDPDEASDVSICFHPFDREKSSSINRLKPAGNGKPYQQHRDNISEFSAIGRKIVPQYRNSADNSNVIRRVGNTTCENKRHPMVSCKPPANFCDQQQRQKLSNTFTPKMKMWLNSATTLHNKKTSSLQMNCSQDAINKRSRVTAFLSKPISNNSEYSEDDDGDNHQDISAHNISQARIAADQNLKGRAALAAMNFLRGLLLQPQNITMSQRNSKCMKSGRITAKPTHTFVEHTSMTSSSSAKNVRIGQGGWTVFPNCSFSSKGKGTLGKQNVKIGHHPMSNNNMSIPHRLDASDYKEERNTTDVTSNANLESYVPNNATSHSTCTTHNPCGSLPSRKRWHLLPTSASLQSLRYGANSVSRLWNSFRLSDSRTSANTSPSTTSSLNTSSTSRKAVLAVTSIADVVARVVAIATVLYFAFHEDIFKLQGRPPI